LNWTVADIAKATGGLLLAGDPTVKIRAISTDTRRIAPGDCFVALRGDRFDGHDFVVAALDRGARAVLVDRSLDLGARTGALIRVDDTLRALGELARAHRARFAIPVVGITGSNGKTSTKEMLAAILGQNRSILKNPGNFNNLIGVPLTLLELEESHEAAVIEMGINVPGEMARLVEIAAPTLGLITNIHPAHLEGLGSTAGILAEKGALWRGLGAAGVAVVNGDDEALVAFARDLQVRQVTFSTTSAEADVHLVESPRISADGIDLRLRAAGQTLALRLPLLGGHQALNALAAAACAHALQVPLQAIRSGLEAYRPVAQRMARIDLPDGTHLIDDTYNANPKSIMAAVDAIEAVRGEHPLILVLGGMKELGPQAAELHRQVGRHLAKVGPALLVTYGEFGSEYLAGAREQAGAGFWGRHAESHAEALDILRQRWIPGAWVLVKGSRSMTMEKVVEGLRGGGK